MARVSWGTVLGLVFALAASACGGGGSSSGGGDPGPGTPPDATLVARLSALLAGDTVSPVVQEDARSAAVLEVYDDGTLQLVVTAELDWVGSVSDVELRQGGPGVLAGALVAEFLTGGQTFDLGQLYLASEVAEAPGTAAAIAAAPSAYHLIILTGGAPTGLVRGQLGTTGPSEVHAALDDGQEEPAVYGGFAASLASDGTANIVFALSGAGIQTSASLRVTETGLPPLDVSLAPATLNLLRGTATLDAQVPVHRLLHLWANPEASTISARDGGTAEIVSGSLGVGALDFLAPVRRRAGDPPTAPSAAGFALRAGSFATGVATIAMPAAPAPTLPQLEAFELVEGPVDNPGGVLFDVLDANDLVVSGPANRAGQGSVGLTRDAVARLLADPSAYHVCVTEAGNPGVLRGPLVRGPAAFFSWLNETPEERENFQGSATIAFEVRTVEQVAYAITSGNPQVTDAVLAGAVVHDADADPSVTEHFNLLDVVPGQSVVDGNFRAGLIEIDRAQVACLLADPRALDVSLTTDDEVTGAARGNIEDGLQCSTGYIPEFEGNWVDDANDHQLNMNREEVLPVPCGPVDGSGTIAGADISFEGRFEGHDMTIMVSETFGSAQAEYQGDVSGQTATFTRMSGSTALPASFTVTNDFRPVYDGLWVSETGMTLTFTDYEANSTGNADLGGFVTVNGTKTAFTGKEDPFTGTGNRTCTLDIPFPGLSFLVYTGEFTEEDGMNVFHLTDADSNSFTFERSTRLRR